jgi:flagellar FliL protein
MPATAPDRRWATNADGSGRRTAPVATAPDDRPAAQQPSSPSKKGGFFRSKKFVIAAVAVLALGGGGYKFLGPKHTPPPTGGTVIPLTSTTLNLAGGHYLKISIAIQVVKGAVQADEFSTSHAAQLMIDEFSNRTVTSISSGAARDALRADLLTKVKHAYPGEVYDLFLTEFVTQ